MDQAAFNVSPSARYSRWLKVGAAVAPLIVAVLAPPPPGLSLEGQRVLAIVVAAVVLWATELVPVAVSSLLVIVLLAVTSGAKGASEAVAGFTWFRWFALMAAPYYVMMALGGVLIYLLYRPGDRGVAAPSEPLSGVGRLASPTCIRRAGALG